eukprot:11074651-Alexandrium_andersonii.AAC.1
MHRKRASQHFWQHVHEHVCCALASSCPAPLAPEARACRAFAQARDGAAQGSGSCPNGAPRRFKCPPPSAICRP